MASAIQAWGTLALRLNRLLPLLLLKPLHRLRGELVKEARDAGLWLYVCPEMDRGCKEHKTSQTMLDPHPVCKYGHGRMEACDPDE